MNALAVILGGGEGSRLQPLTRDRAKPAVPIGGKYRLVDVPISNCINSGVYRIFLLTQFNSVSLHQHVQATYNFDHFDRKFVRILAAQQTPDAKGWYEGTADAVRRTLDYFLEEKTDYVIILSGDQLYRMDFRKVLDQHIANGAELTIATTPVKRSDAGSLGIMHVNDKQRITRFVEKPGNTPLLDELRAPMYKDERYLASMGIYVFNTSTLEKLLAGDCKDFGKQIIPACIENYPVYSYIFDGYWADIGTVGSFWEANLMLTDTVPQISFYDANAPFYTRGRYLPPSKINSCDITRSLISEGCIISGKRIHHSIIGIRGIVGEYTVIEDSIVMGADYYDSRPKSWIGIGRDCYIKKSIIDKNARIGNGVHINPENIPNGTKTDLYTVSDGVLVVPKGTIIPDGMVIK